MVFRVPPRLLPIARAAPSILVVAALVALGAHLNYNFLRPLVEMFGVVIAAAVFMVAWNGRRFGLDPFFMVIGAAYGSAAVLSLLTLAAYGAVPGLNAATQLAVAARYVRAFSLLVGCIVLGRKVRPGLIAAGYGAITAWTASTILGSDVFPACVGQGGEATPFLLWSAPVASAAMIAGAVLLIRRRSAFEPEVLWLLLGSVGLSVLSGVCLCRFSALGSGVGPPPPPGEWSVPQGPWLLLSLSGALDVAGYWLIYRSIVVTGLVTPHRLLLGDLRAREAELQEHREHLEDLVRARTEELRAVSARTEALLAAIPDIVMEVDANKVYTWANPAGLAFFGEDCIGREASYYFEGEQDTYQTVQPLFDSPNGHVVYVESWQRRRDGEKRLLAWWCRTLTDEAGNPIGALSTARDITESRRAEEALAESETRYRDVVEASGDWVWEVDANGVYTYASPRVKEILGYEPEEVVGRTPFDFMPPDEAERVRAAFAAIVARGEPFRGLANKNVRADGQVIEVETNGIPILDASGVLRGYRGMDRDVTDQKRAEERQARLITGLRSVVEAVDELVLTDSVDDLFRRAVELARERLGLERCSIFVAEGKDLRGTYGTDIEGRTTDEHDVVISGHPADKWALSLPDPGAARWFVEEAERTTRDGDGMAPVGPGWIAWTPIQTATRPIGVLFNDSAITGAPLDEVRQDVAAAYCSMLATLVERRCAEEERRASEERLRAMFEASPDGIVLIEPGSLRVLAFNDTACRQLGYTREEFARLRIPDIDAVEAPNEGAHSAGVLAAGDCFEFKTKQRTKGGELRDVLVTSKRLVLQGKTVFHSVWRDITERKRLEEEREALARLNQAILATMPQTVLIVDADLNVVGASRDNIDGFDVAAALANGHPPHLTEVSPPALIKRTRLEQRLRAAIVSGAQEDLTAVHHPASDHPDAQHGDRYVDLQIRPFQLGKDEGAEPRALLSIIDATHRHAMEQHTLQTSKLAAIGTLAGGVAHDFNNILTGIIGYTSILLEDNLDRTLAKEYVEHTHDLAQRAAGLTRQLLLFSRQQAATPVVLDVNACIEGLARMLTRLIGENVKLDLALAPDLAHVRADPTHLEQVIMNLVVNARDAVGQGGRITVQTANAVLDEDYVRVHAGVSAGRYVTIAVSDTGCGMDEATQSRIFEPFFTTKEVGRGTGLGLATVYGIVQEYGGSISVQSEPGCGTTFTVYLPAVTESAPDKGEPEVAPLCGGGETILVVEDETPVAAVIQEALGRRRYVALSARNPAEAEALFEAHQDEVALLLTDVVMPGMLGPELYERLAARKPSLRVIFMSGYTDRAAFGDATIPEGAPFLQKPFEPDALVQKVHSVLTADGEVRASPR